MTTGDKPMPIRVVRGIGKHFPTRAPEWALATMLTLIGARMVMPDRVFDNPALFMMDRFLDENLWGAACLVVGLLRLTALIVNGTLYDIEEMRASKHWVARALVTYSRYSPHVRAVMSLATCFFWFSIFLGLAAGGARGWGVCVYSVLFLLDLWSATRATVDADRVNRNVPA